MLRTTFDAQLAIAWAVLLRQAERHSPIERILDRRDQMDGVKRSAALVADAATRSTASLACAPDDLRSSTSLSSSD
jgi:hypothetical protein